MTDHEPGPELDLLDTRELLLDLRGEPSRCDFCGVEHPADELEPEEAGLWVCHACLDRWEREEQRR